MQRAILHRLDNNQMNDKGAFTYCFKSERLSRVWEFGKRQHRKIFLVGILAAAPFVIDWSEIRGAIVSLDAYILLRLVILSLFFLVFKSTKWWILANSVAHVKPALAMTSYLQGLIPGIVTPARIGEFYRISNLPGSKSKLAYVYLLDRVIDLLALAVPICLFLFLTQGILSGLTALAMNGLGLFYSPLVQRFGISFSCGV